MRGAGVCVCRGTFFYCWVAGSGGDTRLPFYGVVILSITRRGSYPEEVWRALPLSSGSPFCTFSESVSSRRGRRYLRDRVMSARHHQETVYKGMGEIAGLRGNGQEGDKPEYGVFEPSPLSFVAWISESAALAFCIAIVGV